MTLNSIQKKLSAFVGLITVLLFCAAVFAVWSSLQMTVGVKAVHEWRSIILNQALADMMHDAIRGDAMSIYYLSIQKKDPGAQTKYLSSHISEFRARVNENLNNKLMPPDLKERYQGINRLIDRYESDANQVAKYAKTDPEATHRAFQGLQQTFLELETTMSGLTDDLTKSADKVEAHIDQINSFGAFINTFAGIGLALVFLLIGVWLYRLIIRPLTGFRSYLDNIAAGQLTNLSIDKTCIKDREFAQVHDSAAKTVETIQRLVHSLQDVSDRVTQGELDYRPDDAQFPGEFSQVIVNVNHSLDAAVVPLRDAAGVVEQLSKGQIPDPIEKIYNGDFGIMKNLNSCIGAIGLLVKEARTLSDGAIAGQLSIRGDVSRHMGDYQKIIDGFNSTLVALTEPINEMVKVLNAMSAGNLNGEMDGQYAGDFGQIQSAVNQTLGSLNRILNQVLIAADQLKEGAKEISDSAKLISQGATKSASSLEEITSSMQSIEMQAQQNSQNAGQVNDLAVQNKTDAASGSEKMTQMLAAMDEINASSENISKIINVINEIAFQTNLLALNAAVEAARAGRHGKGFAVVAEEVRNLATRSAKAVDETNTLILTSIEKVKMGTEIADLTQQSFSKMVEGAAKVSGLVNDIAKVSEAQTKGIEEINIGINELNKVTQSNAAGSQELASSAQELTNQATHLKEQISKFTLSTKWGESKPRDSAPPVSADEGLKLAFATVTDDSKFGGF